MAAAPPSGPIELHVDERGEGRPVVLVHGWSFSSSSMAPLAAELATSARVLSVDLRGHGGSPAPEGGYGIDDAAADLALALERRAVSGAVLAGWSWGAEVAIAAAERLRPRLAGLALLAPTPRFCAAPGWPHGVPEANVRALSRRLARDEAGTRRLFADGMFAAGEPRPARLDALLAEPLLAHAARATLDALAAADLRERLEPLSGLPVLLVHGDADAVVPPGASAWLAERLPDARREVLPGAGHAPHLATPARVAPLVRVFAEDLA
jgi:pimeloyl-ACP methyl ester carboxylesterase